MHKSYKPRLINHAFILPTVLIVSIIMLSALTLSLSVVWSSRQSLKQQFDLVNARNSSISGINLADGCKYSNNYIISDTITVSTSPLGTRDCGKTAATTANNPFILKPQYGNSLTSFGYTASYIKDTNNNIVAINAISASKGQTVSSYKKQSRAADVSYIPATLPIQKINKFNCPDNRLLRAYDARDYRSYWVRKLADGNCWMLTNLAYGGGGINTYGDVKSLSNGSNDTNASWTVAKYYVDPRLLATTYTLEPTNPSTSTNGSGQAGYLYNFCGANGGQTGNGACSSTSQTAVNTGISVCPSGWRLPTSGLTGGEFKGLNDAINAGSTTSNLKLLSVALFQHRGAWYLTVANNIYEFSGFAIGYYWSSTQVNTTNTYSMWLSSDQVTVDYSFSKYGGFAVRCVAI